jgi:hypothetical protein
MKPVKIVSVYEIRVSANRPNLKVCVSRGSTGKVFEVEITTRDNDNEVRSLNIHSLYLKELTEILQSIQEEQDEALS